MFRAHSAVSLTFVLLGMVPPPCRSFAPIVITSSRTSSSPPCQGSNTGGSFALNVVDDEVVETTKEKDQDKEIGTTKNPLELASWYAVEAFGKAFGSNKSSGDNINKNQSSGSIDFTKPPSSLDETLKRIQIDNDRSYFLSGEVDRLIYDEDCTFADPFVSFDGRDRFIENLSNLGSFITNYDAKMIKYDVENEGKEIVTKVRLYAK